MSGPWWGRESAGGKGGRLVPGSPQPELAPASRDAIAAEVRGRTPEFTPEWTSRRADDAGQALVRLFAEQMEPVLERVNRLPEKAFREVLDAAGVAPLPATPARVLLQFEMSLAAPRSTLIPAGFQVSAQPAGGGDPVTFETERTLWAAPARIQEKHRQQGSLFLAVEEPADAGSASLLPFGPKPRPGQALLLGLAGNATPGPSLTLGIGVSQAAGTPPPVPACGVAPLPVPPAPLLRWEVLDGAAWMPAEVTLDETGGLLRSGTVELRLPPRWRTGRPAGLAGDAALRWLRLRLIRGSYERPPGLSLVRLNMVAATAVRTFFNELLDPVPDTGGRALRLRRAPVLPDSLILEVAEGGFDDQPTPDAGVPADELPVAPGVTRWQAVDDLAEHRPDDRVYVLDPLDGTVTFGDGVHGAVLPPGFRNVRALRYRVGGGAAGAVAAGAASNLLSSAPFVTGVQNPLPATGGTDREESARTLRRGPEEIRARGRAVTVADYPLMALRTRGSRVARAYALAGVHPAFPGRPIPGVVALFVVPRDGDAGGPPVPTQDDLRAVSSMLAAELAPAGVEVVAAAPRYRRVRAEADILVDPAADPGRTVTGVLDAVDLYLDPLAGGDDGQGWPFGRTLEHADLLRRLVALPGIRAVSRLILVVDGIRLRACTDVPLGPGELFWPEGHEVAPVEEEDA